MDSSLIWITTLIGGIISVLLVRFILKTWGNIISVEAAQQADEKIKQEKREGIINSIKIIARCIIEEQVELSEGCIRIKVLLDHIDPTLHEREGFTVFSMMYDGTAHMPTHEKRKKTDRQVIHKLDQQRFKLESDNKEGIVNASKRLLDYPF